MFRNKKRYETNLELLDSLEENGFRVPRIFQTQDKQILMEYTKGILVSKIFEHFKDLKLAESEMLQIKDDFIEFQREFKRARKLDSNLKKATCHSVNVLYNFEENTFIIIDPR